jgi:hypothetical protein
MSTTSMAEGGWAWTLHCQLEARIVELEAKLRVADSDRSLLELQLNELRHRAVESQYTSASVHMEADTQKKALQMALRDQEEHVLLLQAQVQHLRILAQRMGVDPEAELAKAVPILFLSGACHLHGAMGAPESGRPLWGWSMLVLPACMPGLPCTRG